MSLKIIRKLKRHGRETTLDPKRKARIKACLVTVMETYPVQQRDQVRGWSIFFFKPLPYVVAVVILVSVPTAYAADSAMPGDILYPVKTNVVENVRGAMIRNPERRARWDAELVDRRVAEARALEQQGKLNEKTRQQIGGYIIQHRVDAQAHIQHLQELDRNEVAQQVYLRIKAAAHERAEMFGSEFDEEAFDAQLKPHFESPEFQAQVEDRIENKVEALELKLEELEHRYDLLREASVR